MTADALASAEAADVTVPGRGAPAAPTIAEPPVATPAATSLPTLSVPAPAPAPPVSAPPAPASGLAASISASAAAVSAPVAPVSGRVRDDRAVPEPTTPEPTTPDGSARGPETVRTGATRPRGLRPEAAAEEPEQVDEPDRVDGPEADAEPVAAPSGLGLGLLLPLALIWLAATMWSAHASIAERGSASVVMASTAALALPAVIASSLLAGAAAGLTALSRWARDGGVLRRIGLAVAAGAALGLAAVGIVLAAYGTPPAVMILASTVGGAAVLGGVLALIRPTVAVAAGIAATIADFIVATLLSYFQSPLKPIFGGGDTIESRLVAADRFSRAAAFIGGVTAGLAAFAYLRRRARGTRWPTYMLAGALPGLLALAAEGLTRIGGGPLLRAVAGLSVDNGWINEYLDDARISSILTVGFVGAIVATVAVGMTMRRPAEEPEATKPEATEPEATEPDASEPEAAKPDEASS